MKRGKSSPARESGKSRGILSKDATLTDMPLHEVEKATVLKMLVLTGGNKSEAARRHGITRKTLHKNLRCMEPCHEGIETREWGEDGTNLELNILKNQGGD